MSAYLMPGRKPNSVSQDLAARSGSFGRFGKFRASITVAVVLIFNGLAADFVKADQTDTATGAGALHSNTGEGNTADGYYALFSNTTAPYNTAIGFGALYSNTIGYFNTAIGGTALLFNTTGSLNTATGLGALYSNTTGSDNTANGGGALYSNTTGNDNTATGVSALRANTTGPGNTADGYQALYTNTTGPRNTAAGYQALYSSTNGSDNTATGYQALYSNTFGGLNTAAGVGALYSDTTGSGNMAAGYQALYENTTGGQNIAIGTEALFNNTTGDFNIVLGTVAGANIVAGIHNIEIGTSGPADESFIMRIGDPNTQASTFIAGIRGVTTGNSNAVAVYIDSNGQLGTINSSARFKEDIQDMGTYSRGLYNLRPVTYHYKEPAGNENKPLEFGLIAEEVAQIYPDLVVYGRDGQLETVQYHKLTPMLLNEVQRQHREIADLRSALAALRAELHAALGGHSVRAAVHTARRRIASRSPATVASR
ncbi:MAG TPA: tail fiber domain-containing protein [Methylocella sp.]|nr:tail fiber domain-containing protein [Methylocella sp.]